MEGKRVWERNGELVFGLYGVSVWEEEKVPEMGGGGVVTAH